MKRIPAVTAIAKLKMIAAMEKSLCVVSTAAKKAGIDRRTHYKWMQADPEYAENIKELEDVSIDFAESCLFSQMKRGDNAPTIFYLKTKGKKRGYVEGMQVIGHVDATEQLTDDEIKTILKQAGLEQSKSKLAEKIVEDPTDGQSS
jgi:hypothetical protein